MSLLRLHTPTINVCNHVLIGKKIAAFLEARDAQDTAQIIATEVTHQGKPHYTGSVKHGDSRNYPITSGLLLNFNA